MVKVKKHGNSTILSIGWKELIDDPIDEKNFKEAFANADALIDSTAEYLLKHIYGNHKCNDLISEIHHLRGRVNFDGLILLEILKSKTIIDEKLLQRVRNFKKARNIVLHKLEGIAGLLNYKEFKEIIDENYENKLIEKAKRWLEEAKKIDFALSQKFSEIDKKGVDYYFSDQFYIESPRVKEFMKGGLKDPKE